jgi:hypothetical protein
MLTRMPVAMAATRKRPGPSARAALIDGGLLTGGDGHHHPAQARDDRLSAGGHDVTYRLTPAGRRELRAFGLDLHQIWSKRPAIRYCVEWSEQRHHLAGPLGTALTDRLFELDWVQRTARRRAVILTEHGRNGLHDTFGLGKDWDDEP